MNFVPGSDTDVLLNDIVDARAARTCRVVFPNGVVAEFRANIVNYETADPNDDKLTATVTWRVTGTVSMSTLSPYPVLSASGSLSVDTTQIEFPSTISLDLWLDPSDLSTLWQDAAATVPVTADGDPVRLYSGQERQRQSLPCRVGCEPTDLQTARPFWNLSPQVRRR